MSFINSPARTGRVFAPGWFMADNEDCSRETREISAEGVTADENGGKHVPMGTIYPANDGTAVGILYEDVDVTFGNMPGSVVTRGAVYKDRLPEEPAAAAIEALGGITFIDEAPTVTRPADGRD